jgi:hypothetical protein
MIAASDHCCSSRYRSRRGITQSGSVSLMSEDVQVFGRIGVTPRPGTSGNAGCGRSCTRSPCGRRSRSRSARHTRRAPPCDSARSHSSPSIGRGLCARCWRHAKPDRDRGECPRPPELVEPWPGATASAAARCLASHACGAARSGHRAGSRSWRSARWQHRCSGPSSRASRARAVPESRECRCRAQADGSQSCGEAYAERAFYAAPPLSLPA